MVLKLLKLYKYNLFVLGLISSSLFQLEVRAEQDFNKNHTSDCSRLLGSTVEDVLSTEEIFVSYLLYLVNQKIISGNVLDAFVSELEMGRFQVSILLQQSLANSVHKIHLDALNLILDGQSLDLQRILKIVLEIKNKAKLIEDEKNRASIKTKSPFLEMKFVVIPISPKYDLEVMTVPVTQMMWAKEMKRNPFAHFAEQEILVDGLKIRMDPDSPVIGWNTWSAMMYANRISLSMGLQSTYDFKDVEFDSDHSSAEDGSLLCEFNGARVLSVHAKDKRLINAEGFRLPTKNELEMILAFAKKADGLEVLNIEEIYHLYEKNSKANPLALTQVETVRLKSGKQITGPVDIDSIFADVGFRLVRTVKKR